MYWRRHSLLGHPTWPLKQFLKWFLNIFKWAVSTSMLAETEGLSPRQNRKNKIFLLHLYMYCLRGNTFLTIESQCFISSFFISGKILNLIYCLQVSYCLPFLRNISEKQKQSPYKTLVVSQPFFKLFLFFF